MTDRLVLAPDLAFGNIASALAALGWTPARQAYARPPLLSGEPEVAAFERPDSDGRLVYTFNPAVRLRTLGATGSQARGTIALIGLALPTLAHDDIDRLLRSPEPRQALLGMMAAHELGLADRAGPVAELASHPDPTVARAASIIAGRLGAGTVDQPPPSTDDGRDVTDIRNG